MRICVFALGLLLCVASLFAQKKRVSWEDICFKNPASPVCGADRGYAVKPPAPEKDTGPRNGVTKTMSTLASPTPRSATPALTVVGAIDWRFADPFPDALVGFNFSSLSASPLARNLIAQLGAQQGLTEVDMKKIFDGLSGVDQVALSVRNNQIVVMASGRVVDTTLPPPEPGLKVVPAPGNAMLFGHADAVDWAVRRMSLQGAPTELARLAEEKQGASEFWAIGSAGLVGPQAVSAGVKRFSLTVSIRDRFTSDVAFEFNGVPSTATLKTWQTSLGAATLEGNVLHVRTSMEAAEVQQKFGEIAASPVGQRLADLVKAAQYLPARDTTVPKRTRPVIYGLDGGPREVN